MNPTEKHDPLLTRRERNAIPWLLLGRENERVEERAEGESKLHRQTNLHRRRKPHTRGWGKHASRRAQRVQSKRAIAGYHFRITRFSSAHPCARSCGADRAIRHTHARYPPSGSFAATTVDAAAVVVEKTLPLKKSPPTLRPTSLRRTFVDRRSRGGSPTRSYHAADTHLARTHARNHAYPLARPP